MKLRIKETNEVLEDVKVIDTTLHKLTIQYLDNGVLREHTVKNLSDIEEIKDYEEPKGSALDLMILIIINFIENEPDEDKVDLEDCKQMLEKLKAVKRLKDKGFRFIPEASYIEEQSKETGESIMFIACTMNDDKDFIYGDNKDLKLLFGGDNDS